MAVPERLHRPAYDDGHRLVSSGIMEGMDRGPDNVSVLVEPYYESHSGNLGDGNRSHYPEVCTLLVGLIRYRKART